MFRKFFCSIFFSVCRFQMFQIVRAQSVTTKYFQEKHVSLREISQNFIVNKKHQHYDRIYFPAGRLGREGRLEASSFDPIPWNDPINMNWSPFPIVPRPGTLKPPDGDGSALVSMAFEFDSCSMGKLLTSNKNVWIKIKAIKVKLFIVSVEFEMELNWKLYYLYSDKNLIKIKAKSLE